MLDGKEENRHRRGKLWKIVVYYRYLKSNQVVFISY